MVSVRVLGDIILLDPSAGVNASADQCTIPWFGSLCECECVKPILIGEYRAFGGGDAHANQLAKV